MMSMSFSFCLSQQMLYFNSHWVGGSNCFVTISTLISRTTFFHRHSPIEQELISVHGAPSNEVFILSSTPNLLSSCPSHNSYCHTWNCHWVCGSLLLSWPPGLKLTSSFIHKRQTDGMRNHIAHWNSAIRNLIL